LNFATVDLLPSQRFNSQLPELWITEEHNRESARLPIRISNENNLVDGLTKGLEVRL